MDIIETILSAPIATLIIVTGLVLVVVSFIDFPFITFSGSNRSFARWVGLMLFFLGFTVHLLSVFYLDQNSENVITERKQEQYTIKTFSKDGERKNHKSVYSSTENIFVEFNFKNPDIADNKKLIRWVSAGKPENAKGPYKWVGNSGEVEIGTLKPGPYEVRAFLRRDDRSYKLLVQELFEVEN